MFIYYFLALLLAFIPVNIFSLEQTLDQRLSECIKIDPNTNQYIGYLRLSKDTPIQESTFLYVKFAVEEFKKNKVPFVLLHLDSPGGEVFAALKISQQLKMLDSQDHIPVVAFIDNWALSAGALIAYSCRFIGITPDASMGAAEPVMASNEGKMESASEKINSALRAEFSNSARFFNRDPLIAEAMVDKDVILVQRNGKIIRLESEADIVTNGPSKDVIISRKGKLLTLDAKQMIELGVADFEVPYQTLSPITQEEQTAGMWPFSKTLLSKQPFFSQFASYNIISYQSSKIDFFTFLSHPLISSLLFMGLILGVYAEMSHPGSGIFGALALVCLGLILLSSFASYAIHWLELIVFLVGVILLCVEIFILPGFGIAGVIGTILTIGGLIALMLPHFPGLDFSTEAGDLSLLSIELLQRLGYLLTTLIICFVLMTLLSRYVFRGKFFLKRIVLSQEMDKEKGFVATLERQDLPDIGMIGVAHTSLRPSGKVLIAERLYDAQALHSFIDQGSNVEIVQIEAGKIIVRLKKG